MYQILKYIDFPKIKLNPSYIITFLFIVNSGFHIKNIPTYLTMYFTFYIAIIYLFITSFKKLLIDKSFVTNFCIIWIIYLLTTQIFLGGDIIVTLASIITFIFYILTRLLLQKCSIKDVLIISDCTIIYNLILFFIDAIYRFNLAGLNIINNFYIAKANSLLHADSNATGINTTLLTFYSFYLFTRFKNTKYLVFTCCCMLFTILTLSRAAMIATIFSFGIFLFYKIILKLCSKKTTNYNHYIISIKTLILNIFLILFLISIFSLLPFLIQFLLQDGSFITKIDLFGFVLEFFQNMPFNNILFGIGFDNTVHVFNFYAHTYLATYIIETGLLGYILITSFLSLIFLEHKKTIYILLPFFFLGFSYIGHTILNLFYVLLAVICCLEKQLKNNKNYQIRMAGKQ